MEELLERVKSKSLQQTLEDPSDLKEIYKQMGESICLSCPGIIKEKYLSLFKVSEEKIISKMDRILRMKPGKLIDTTMSNVYPQGQFTDSNITDQISIKLIDMGYGAFFVNPEKADELRFVKEIEVNPIFKNESKSSKSQSKDKI